MFFNNCLRVINTEAFMFREFFTFIISISGKKSIKTLFMKKIFFAFFIIFAFLNIDAQDKSSYFTIENYYKVKWGYADEFINLWKVNHYPLLKKAMEKGDIISVEAEKPKLHSGEDTRFDFKVTIVFKNEKLAFDNDLTKQYERSIYPDTEKFKKDEQHRFELLIAHWDVMIEKIVL